MGRKTVDTEYERMVVRVEPAFKKDCIVMAGLSDSSLNDWIKRALIDKLDGKLEKLSAKLDEALMEISVKNYKLSQMEEIWAVERRERDDKITNLEYEVARLNKLSTESSFKCERLTDENTQLRAKCAKLDEKIHTTSGKNSESNINVTLDLETTISQLIDEKFASMGIKTPTEHDLRKYNEMKDWAAAAKFADGYTTAHPLGDDEHYIVERKNNRFYLSKIRHLHSENQECIETSEISQADLDKTRTEITDNDVISFMMLPSFNGYITSGESE